VRHEAPFRQGFIGHGLPTGKIVELVVPVASKLFLKK